MEIKSICKTQLRQDKDINNFKGSFNSFRLKDKKIFKEMSIIRYEEINRNQFQYSK